MQLLQVMYCGTSECAKCSLLKKLHLVSAFFRRWKHWKHLNHWPRTLRLYDIHFNCNIHTIVSTEKGVLNCITDAFGPHCTWNWIIISLFQRIYSDTQYAGCNWAFLLNLPVKPDNAGGSGLKGWMQHIPCRKAIKVKHYPGSHFSSNSRPWANSPCSPRLCSLCI